MNESAVHLEAWLKERRIQKGRFAEGLGISKPALSRFLKGDRVPSIKLAAQIETKTAGFVSIKGWAKEHEGVEA